MKESHKRRESISTRRKWSTLLIKKIVILREPMIPSSNLAHTKVIFNHHSIT